MVYYKTARRKKEPHLGIGKNIKAKEATSKENMTGLYMLKINMTTQFLIYSGCESWNRKGVSSED